jgi:hypothetical protein
MACPKPKQSKGDSPESTAEKLASGEITIPQAIRRWLNDYPMKRGWYIATFLVMLIGYVLFYHITSSKIESAERERDKYFVSLQPWQAMAASIFTNQPPEKRLDLLAKSMTAISNALTYATTGILTNVSKGNAAQLTNMPFANLNFDRFVSGGSVTGNIIGYIQFTNSTGLKISFFGCTNLP